MARDDHGHDRTAAEGGGKSSKRARMPRPQGVSDLLASVFSGKPAARLLREIFIWEVWDEVVGPQVARRARPSAIRDGVLTVTVASGPWLQQLTFLKGEIITRLNEKAGEDLVREIYLKAGNPQSARRPPTAKQHHSRPLTDEEEQFIERQVSLVKDDELRDELAALMRRHLMSKDDKPEKGS